MPDGKGTADEERDRKKRFIPKHARGAFLVELLLRGLSKNASVPDLPAHPESDPRAKLFHKHRVEWSSSFRKAYRVHAVADSRKLFAESRKE